MLLCGQFLPDRQYDFFDEEQKQDLMRCNMLTKKTILVSIGLLLALEAFAYSGLTGDKAKQHRLARENYRDEMTIGHRRGLYSGALVDYHEVRRVVADPEFAGRYVRGYDLVSCRRYYRRLGRPYPPLTTKRVVKGPRNSQRRAHPSSLRPELRPGKPLGLTRAPALHFGRPLGPCVCADSAVHGTRDWSKANGDRVFDGQSAKRLVIDLHAQAEAG